MFLNKDQLNKLKLIFNIIFKLVSIVKENLNKIDIIKKIIIA